MPTPKLLAPASMPLSRDGARSFEVRFRPALDFCRLDEVARADQGEGRDSCCEGDRSADDENEIEPVYEPGAASVDDRGADVGRHVAQDLAHATSSDRMRDAG